MTSDQNASNRVERSAEGGRREHEAPRWSARLLQFFQLKDRSREASLLSRSGRLDARAFFDAAERRLEGARQLRELGAVTAALVLFREGAELLARATLVAKGGEDIAALSAREAFERLAAAFAGEDSGPPPAILASFAELAAQEWPEIDRLPAVEASELAANLDAATRWLSERIEPLPPRKLAALRRWRIALAAFGFLVLPIAWAIWRLNPTNLAPHKKVSASSVEQGSSADIAVDGVLYAYNAFRSNVEEAPWIAVDLGEPYFITDAEVYGRHDCCVDKSVPLAFELSDDGEKYRTISERKEPFELLTPWFVDGISSRARYVRVRSQRKTSLELTEVVVFGRKP